MPTEDRMKYIIEVAGGPEAERAISAIARAVQSNTKAVSDSAAANGRAATASAVATRATSAATAATSGANVQFNTFGSTLGSVAQAIGRVSPVAGQMVQTLSQATGTIQTLTSAGLGPFGIAVGAVTAGLGILTAAIDHFTDEQARADEQLATRSIPALSDYVAAVGRAREADRLRSLVSGGRGSEEQQTGFFDEAVVQRARLQEQIRDLEQSGRDSFLGLSEAQEAQLSAYRRREGELLSEIRNRANLRRQAVAEEARRNAEARDAEAAVAASAAAEKLKEQRDRAEARTRNQRGRGRTDGISERQEEINLTNKLNDAESRLTEELVRQGEIQAQLNAKREEYARQQVAAAERVLEETRAKEDAALQERLGREREWRGSMGKGADGAGDKDSERVSKQIDMYKELGSTAASALESSIAAGGNAGAVMQNFFKDMAGNLAKIEVGKAIAETAEGLGALASVYLAGTAPTHFASAAQHAAAAGAFGLLGAAIPSASTGGGAAAAPKESRPQKSGTSSGSGDTTVIVNFGGEVVTAATEAELGRRIGRMVDAGRTRLGR